MCAWRWCRWHREESFLVSYAGTEGPILDDDGTFSVDLYPVAFNDEPKNEEASRY
jgi:hypothetical protein